MTSIDDDDSFGLLEFQVKPPRDALEEDGYPSEHYLYSQWSDLKARPKLREILHLKNIRSDTKIIESKGKKPSDLWTTYIHRGDAYYGLGKNTLAEKDYTSAIELQGGNYQVYSKRADFYCDIGKLKEAIGDYTKVIELDKEREIRNDNIHYYNRGYVYIDLSDCQNALKDFSKAIEIDKDDYQAYNNRGFTLNMLGRYSEAIKDFDHALTIDSTSDANLYKNRAVAYANIGQSKKALEDFESALKLNSESEKAFYERGKLYCSLNLFNEALKDFEKGHAIMALKAKEHPTYEKKALRDRIKKQIDFLQLLQGGLKKNTSYFNVICVVKFVSKDDKQ